VSEPFLGEIKIMSFNFAPKGWAFANGQFLPINQNQALFALLGTTYGGNGQTTFALPDLRGRAPFHLAPGHSLGEAAGQESHTLTVAELPAHTHIVNGSRSDGNDPTVTGHVPADSPSQIYSAPAALTTLHPSSVSTVGGTQPHTNLAPYLVLNFCIALQGIFPSQS
jgi:microcystin-dependent protein